MPGVKAETYRRQGQSLTTFGPGPERYRTVRPCPVCKRLALMHPWANCSEKCDKEARGDR